MKYISTRGQSEPLNFEDVLLAGLAKDGGLYIPETLPEYSADEIRSWRGLPYNELAYLVIHPFVAGAVEDDDLRKMIDDSYRDFSHSAVAPLHQTGSNEFVLELFRGPTLAFKDFALQLLGRLLDYTLAKRGERAVVLGATSGDTGSAAIEGCRHSDHIDIFILHPHNRVSEVQRRQMTTVLSGRVHNLAVKGNFDDCQRMVKTSFADQSFLRGEYRLVAVNSINWARIMAQIVYYFYAALNLGGPDREVAFSVPTGNFGDIFAGYLAKKMGLPINQLIIATNQNDILHRFLSDNEYKELPLHHSLSPSMDIVVSSNFERLLFDLVGRDGDKLNALMQGMQSNNASLSEDALAQARQLFASYSADDQATIDTIASVYGDTQYLLDPHTAIGVKAAREVRWQPEVPMVILGTAHPVKFAEAVEKAGCNTPELPAHMSDLLMREERYMVVDNELSQIHDNIAKTLFS